MRLEKMAVPGTPTITRNGHFYIPRPNTGRPWACLVPAIRKFVRIATKAMVQGKQETCLAVRISRVGRVCGRGGYQVRWYIQAGGTRHFTRGGKRVKQMRIDVQRMLRALGGAPDLLFHSHEHNPAPSQADLHTFLSWRKIGLLDSIIYVIESGEFISIREYLAD